MLVAAGLFLVPVAIVSAIIVLLLHPHKTQVSKLTPGSAFNTELPSPNVPTGEKNKLEIYMKAEQDSIKQNQERAKDPYSKDQASTATPTQSPVKTPGFLQPQVISNRAPAGLPATPEENERKVNDRLQRIYSAIGSPGAADAERKSPYALPSYPTTDQSPQIAKLERLMQVIQHADTATSPQLAQVKQILDQIKDLQDPNRLHPPAIPAATSTRPMAVEVSPTAPTDSMAQPAATENQNGFFGLSDGPDSSAASTSSPAIQAVVHTDQLIQTGSTVKLRLLQPIYVGGQKIPANTFIYGPASITGERVSIELTNAIYDGRIYPISLKVYDGVDGLEGLYVPGMITRDIVKQNMSQGVSGVSIGTLDPSLGAQAAAAGIQTARNLLSRKISIVKATLKADHLAILKPNGPLR
ncbi:conjugative transposon protein TraM [Puia dinghuensis]|nr:conjugative transposon protein TraM [Puia dinghuensis]